MLAPAWPVAPRVATCGRSDRCRRPRCRRIIHFGDGAQQLAAIAKDDTKIFQILIGQVAKDREIDAVLGKALGVLGHAEFFQPVRDLLHRTAPTRAF